MLKNLFILPRLGMSLKELYFLTLIDLSRAKIVIGHNITGLAFRIKKIKKDLITITYQHSYIYPFEKKIYKKLLKNCSCDYFLSYDKSQTKLFFDLIEAKFLELGSLKNNEIILKKNIKNKLLIISEFRLKNSNLHLKAIKSYLRNIRMFCLRYKIIPKIALNSFRIDKKHLGTDIFFENEIQFYKKYLGSFNYEKKTSYQLAAESKVIISMSSNLGYELLSRGYKVLFFNNLGNLNKKFISTYFEKQKPIFFLKNNNYQNFEKKFKKIEYMSSLKWKKVLKNFQYKIKFDQGNKELNQLIKRII